VTNQEIVVLFNEIADMMDILGEDSFRVLSYRRAARQLESLTEVAADLVRQGRVHTIPGIGSALAEKIKEFVQTGKMETHEELRGRFPPGVLDLLRLRGLGPKKVRVLWQELGITDIDMLKKAAETHRLQRLSGFGEKTEANLLRSIELAKEGASRLLLMEADGIAARVIGHLQRAGVVGTVMAGGSLRRMKETVGDVDILAVTSDPERAMKAFVGMPEVREIVAAGEKKSVVLYRHDSRHVQVDLRLFGADSWGAALQYNTGSLDHNVRLRTMAERSGLKLNEYGVYRGDERIAGASEEDVYAALGLPWIPPEIREDQGEVQAAKEGRLPRLVEPTDIQGDFHVHTNETDGTEPLEAMVDAARECGYAFVGISDHSVSAAVAFGLPADKALARRDRVRGLNRERKGFTALLGTECDILGGGEMDYPDEVLREFDFVIASVHSRFTQPREEMTARVVAAVSNPHVDILGHPTTRKIGERDPVDLDLEEVFAACAKAGTAIEVDADPRRMDLDAPKARAAKEAGCTLAVDTDAHGSRELGWMRFGVGTARRAWLTRDDVLNAWPLERVRAFLA
jgi:DNA polymerase (family 10)